MSLSSRCMGMPSGIRAPCGAAAASTPAASSAPAAASSSAAATVDSMAAAVRARRLGGACAGSPAAARFGALRAVAEDAFSSAAGATDASGGAAVLRGRPRLLACIGRYRLSPQAIVIMHFWPEGPWNRRSSLCICIYLRVSPPEQKVGKVNIT